MAKIDCNKLANIIATWIIWWDDDLAKELAELSRLRNGMLERSRRTGEWVDALTWMDAHKLELKAESADIMIRWIVQAQILWGRFGAEAYDELARQITKMGWGLAEWMTLLNKVKNANPVDYEDIARAWWSTSGSPADVVKEIKQKLDTFMATNYSLKQYTDLWQTSAVQVLKKQYINKEITQDEFIKEYKKLYDKALDNVQKAKDRAAAKEAKKKRKLWAKDKKHWWQQTDKVTWEWSNAEMIKNELRAPSWYSAIDNEWQTIVKIAENDWEDAMDTWVQYVMAREIIAVWADWTGWTTEDSIIKFFRDSGTAKNLKNYTWPLTLDQIEKIDDLSVLLSKAFTNTKQLMFWSDAELLRDAYAKKLNYLASRKKLNYNDIEKLGSLIRTMQFVEQWATFSNVVIASSLYNRAKRLWLDVSWTNWKELYNWLRNFAQTIWDWELPDVIEIAWVKMLPTDVIQLIYTATWDRNIIKLLERWEYDSGTVLNIATQYLLWNNKAAANKIIALYKKAKLNANISKPEEIALDTITGQTLADRPKAFFNFRKWLYIQDENTRAKADLMDLRANRNKMTVSTEIEDLTDSEDLIWTLREKYKGWYLIVSDSRWRDNKELDNILKKVNETEWRSDEDKITVIYPRWAMSWRFDMEWRSLIFKTENDDMFDEIAWTASIKSLWESIPTERMRKEMYEITTGEWTEIDTVVSTSGWTPLVVYKSNKNWTTESLTYSSEKVDWEEWTYLIIKHPFEINAKKNSINSIFYEWKKMSADDFSNYVKELNKQLKWWDKYDWVVINNVWLKSDTVYIALKENQLSPLSKWEKEVWDEAQALIDYNNDIDDAARKYYWELLWIIEKKVVDWKVVTTIDKNTLDRINNVISEKTWIPVKVIQNMPDRWNLWQMVDERISLSMVVSGKFEKQMINVQNEIDRIADLSDDVLASEVNKSIWGVVSEDAIKNSNNLSEIRDAYIDFRTAENEIDYLQAKWKLISLSSWWSAETMKMADIQSMFQNRTFATVYKDMFFPNQTIADKDLNEFCKLINDDLFNTISVAFANNLVNAWYSLPLANVRDFIYIYLTWWADWNNTIELLNTPFIQSLFYKNNIPFTTDNIHSIIDNLLPQDIKFNYEDALYKWRQYSIDNAERAVYRETENVFLPDTYSALVAIDWAKKWMIPSGQENKILSDILDRYIEAFRQWFQDKTLTFQKAQQIKLQASYALDMFEQEIVLSKYWRLLTPADRQSLLGSKYALPIYVDSMSASKAMEEMKWIKNRILDNYKKSLKRIAKENDIDKDIAKWLKWEDEIKEAKINARKQKLVDSWATIKKVWEDYVVVDARQELISNLQTLPGNIKWLESVKALWTEGINSLSNKQVYALLSYIESAKALNTNANIVTNLMYKQSPMLAKYNFFENFRIAENWLPRALYGNALKDVKILKNFDNTSDIDKEIKEWIFWSIKSFFREGWQGYITKWELEWLVDKWIKDTKAIERFEKVWVTKSKDKKAITNFMRATYINAFTPYTYLRDLPTWWVLVEWGMEMPNVKKRVETLLKQKYQQTQIDITNLDIPDMDVLQDRIIIQLENWDEKSLRQLWDESIDSWKETIFNEENIFVEEADKVWLSLPDPTKKLTEKEERNLELQNKQYRENIINSYNWTLQAMMDWVQLITEWERALMSSILMDVRQKLRRYSLTNMLSDAADATYWLNEEIGRWIKDYLIWLKGRVTAWRWGTQEIMDRWAKVQEAYSRYYPMSLQQIIAVKPTTRAEDLAKNMARYFKTLEHHLGSADWVLWCTTREDINRAFFHLWEAINDIKDIKWIYWILSGIEQNQIFKFFKFGNPRSKYYVREFVRTSEDRTDWWLTWYRDYVTKLSWISREQFNTIFGSAYNDEDFKKILQGLTWFTLTNDWWWRRANNILSFANGSNTLIRIAMSYPWQLLTIPQQWVAYFLKQTWLERKLWAESLSAADNIRMKYSVLDWAYNELPLNNRYSVNPDDLNPNSFYNRYWIPDVNTVYANTAIDSTDDYLSMYSKIDKFWASSIWATNQIVRQFDPYKDNANNIIDGLFARNFKNLSFVKAIKENDFMQFASAQAFDDFMSNPAVSREIKDRLMDRINVYSARNFRNILWLGFWWIDRPIAWSTFWNIMVWLMQLFNFRWAWWQNIFKQTWEFLMTWMKIVKNEILSTEWKDALARYMATQPEFLNFITALMNDTLWAFRLSRFQDNGRWPEDDEHTVLDYIEYITENLNMTSQWRQWIESFWPARPFIQQVKSASRHLQNPTVYKDTRGIWAFFNALWTNAWRQWKPYNWAAKAVWAWTTDWWGWAWAYIQNELWKLSFWSLRYMMDEDVNSYGYTTEITWEVWWIPGILMWEAQRGSDKEFNYNLNDNETWETMKALFDWDVARDDRWTYAGNLWKTVVNSSQLFSLPKNVTRALTRSAPSYYTAKDLSEVIQNTWAWKEFYDKWYVTPATEKQAEIFFNTILENWKYRPWSSSFNKSLMNFEKYGHMNGKDKGNEADAEMEFWLDHMKHPTNARWDIISQDKIDNWWTLLLQDLNAHYYNQTYVTDTIYNYAKEWLNQHTSDPHYQLYVKLLWQWYATNLIENAEDEAIKALNIWKKWTWDKKWTETEFEQASEWYYKMLLNLWNSLLPWEDVTLFDKLQVLDQDASIQAALTIIKEETTNAEDRDVLDKFFETKEQEDWTKITTMKNSYKSILTQFGSMARALEDWNIDRFIAESSSIANQFMQDDPSGLVTTSLIDSIYQRVYNTDSLSPELKLETMAALFHHNKDFIERNSEKLREVMWDDYDVVADYMNWIIYQWDGETISTLESLVSSWKSANSGSGKTWKALSSAFKETALKVWWSNYSRWNWWTSSSYKQFAPMQIKWASLVKELWVKWYSPNVAKLSFESFKPKLDLSLSKDINRKVKTTKPQTISSKKQLSKLEEKATKAIEAES